MKSTFRGGVHPKEKKELAKDAPLRIFDPKGEMVFPLSMHIGKPAKPVVKRNDPVLAGQCIAEADGFISANVICSCSGKVKAIEKRRTISGALLDCIVVENDGQFTLMEGIGEERDLSTVTNEEIIEAVKKAGIVGLGGAGFPTNVKLMPKNPDGIRYVIANGAECEPYLTCNDRLMQEKASEILDGLELMLRLFKNAEGVVCIEKNKPEAIRAMQEALAGRSRITVHPLKTKYPQGAEKMLIKVISGREVPMGGLPMDVGAVVQNVGTVAAIADAVEHGLPLTERITTVTGDAIREPKNLRIRIGTSYQAAIDYCGGFKQQPKKLIAGGPMMGMAQATAEVPVMKGSSGILALTAQKVDHGPEMNCIRCGKCVKACPMGLVPSMLSILSERQAYDACRDEYGLMNCVECGCCTFVCPAKRNIVQYIKNAKGVIRAEQMKAKAAAEAKKKAQEAAEAKKEAEK